MMKEVKVRVNLNTGKSTVIRERIIAEDLHGTDAYCEHILKQLEENNMYPNQGGEELYHSNLIN